MNRERVTKLRDFLRDEVADERFNIRALFSREGRALWDAIPAVLNECGTAACVAGWAGYLFRLSDPQADAGSAATDLSLSRVQRDALFMPTGHFSRPERYTRAMAVATLTHLLETGEVRWPESDGGAS